jgi:uncharacterized damage-inducible protein DinB
MVPELVSCLDRTVAFVLDQTADLSEEEMVLQPTGAANHAAWTLGHIIYSFQAIAGELGVKAWLPENWESRFGYGSLPSSVVPEHEHKRALLSTLEDSTRRLRAALLAMDERSLGDPLPDEKSRELLPTKAHALLQVVAGHTAYHAGQLTVWRRAIGRKPIGVFI